MATIEDELALLESMYPEQIHFDRKASQILFRQANGSMALRLPADYPSTSLPDVIEATGPHRSDLRQGVQQIIRKQQIGDPCLDAILIDFLELLESKQAAQHQESTSKPLHQQAESEHKTVIVWLHHLLATGKRKQALSPDCVDGALINGITKPGYPGILIFSGSATPVEAHVQTLKHLRWQAFQVRFESAEAWSFAHGKGIVEMETMAEVVADIGDAPGKKELFMEIMKIK